MFSETSVITCKAAQFHNPEDQKLKVRLNMNKPHCYKTISVLSCESCFDVEIQACASLLYVAVKKVTVLPPSVLKKKVFFQ
jgi:hypothetical protein